jgi:hypothetical protein
MDKIVNRMLCETHQCPITITGCMKRQNAAQNTDPTRSWRASASVPIDPKCADCAQGKEIMKKYKHRKGELMAADKSITQQEKEAPAIVTPVAEKSVPAPATNPCAPVVEGKTCNRCDLVVGMDEAGKHFYTSKHTKDGFEGICKRCKTERAAARRRAKRTDEELAKRAGTKPKKNQKKAAVASPKKKVEKVVTAEQTDTIKKNDHPVDMDETVKHLFESTGHPHLYEELKKAAFADMRPPHLQALYLIACSLDPFGKVS